jgi:hypothetical protein
MRPRYKRPRSRAAKQGNELAPSHEMALDEVHNLAHCPNRTHAPSSLQNIRLSSDVPNPLSRSRNWQADGDGCLGLHLTQVPRSARSRV